MILVMMVAVVAFIVLVERGERRIPVQYAKRVMGRRVMGGQATHMPLKVNAGGVIPVIFASSILAFPQTTAQSAVCQEQPWLSDMLDSHPARRAACTCCCSSRCIIFFCFFYVSIIFNPNEAADNMRKYGGFIPGIRPGTQYCRLHEHHPDQDHVRGRHLPVHSLPDSRHHDLRDPSAAPAAGRQFHRCPFPALPPRGLERTVSISAALRC